VGDLVRIGFLGNGLISWAHSLSIDAMVKSGGLEVAISAGYDPDQERAGQFAAVHGSTPMSSPEAVCEAADAVFVCTPTALHAPLVEVAAKRGCAVFCEKPLAVDVESARRMAEVVENAGVPAQVGLVLRTTPVFRALRALVTSGRLGRPLSAVLRDDQFFPVQGHYASSWRGDPAMTGGGTLIEHSIHDLDILQWCLGPVRSVSAEMGYGDAHPGVEEVAAVILVHDSGAISTVTSVWHEMLSRHSTRRLEVFFEHGLAWLEDDFVGPLHIEDDQGVVDQPCPMDAWVADLPLEGDLGVAIAMYAVEDKAFCDSVQSHQPPVPSFAEGVLAHELVDAAYRSAAQGRRLEMPEKDGLRRSEHA